MLTSIFLKERLNPAVRSQICGELHMRNLPELCDSLDNLDVTISFLKSVGSNPSMSLNDFMENTLKIDKPFISTKVLYYIARLIPIDVDNY